MAAEFTNKARLVRCPKCRLLLPELPDFQVYECGGCGAILQAKKRLNGLRSRSRVIPHDQTVLDIVDDTNGSALNRSPLHSIGSHDYNSYGQTHQATGHDDSNPIQSLSLSIGSDDAVTNNSVPGHVVTTSVWIFSVTGIGFEAVSAFFDQVSSPRKPHYALYGMLLSIVAVLVCILDLIHNAMKQNGVASASEMLWGILPEVFGLALASIQCISSALQFSFLCRHAENPVKLSLLPFLFFLVLFAFKYRNGRN